MSTAAKTFGAAPLRADAVRRDTLAASVVFLVGLSCIQPLVTFLRGILFCRWLDPDQLGRWDVVLGFLTIAAPIVVLGIPGSFGRYVEHYSQRGQLAMFLRRTSLACIVLGGLAISALLWWSPFFSYLMFGQGGHGDLIMLVAVALATMVAFGFTVELLTALRMFRVVSVLHFAKGATFALAGLALLLLWQSDTSSVIAGHTLACCVPMLIALFWLVPLWRSLPAASVRGEEGFVGHRALWSRFLPFAIGIWVANFFTNVFAIIDRYMIIHFSGLPASKRSSKSDTTIVPEFCRFFYWRLWKCWRESCCRI